MKVLVYTLPNCVQCDMTKKQFKAHDVAYEEIKLDENPKAVEGLKERYGFTQAPIIITSAGEAWSGFKLDRIKGVIKAIHAEKAVHHA